MPYVSACPPRRLLVVAAALVAFALALLTGASAASADASACPIPSASQVFSQFGDDAYYSLVPGGSFESDMSGWTLNDASVVSDNEPWYVGAAGDSQALSIRPGGSAVSPAFCVNDLFPTWRFFARVAWGSGFSRWSSLAVSVEWTDQNGNYGVTRVAALGSDFFRTWRPTPTLLLGPVLDDSTTMTERLVFSAGDGAGWRIDDVYIDPYAKR
jgi:hypothetical protein